jgi:hypothetical protein
LPRSRGQLGARSEVRRRFFLLGASSCSSVLLPGARLKTKETVEMPVCGKHGKAMKRFPTLPTVLGNRCGYFTHSHRRDYDGIYFQVPPVKRYEGRGHGQTPSWAAR